MKAIGCLCLSVFIVAFAVADELPDLPAGKCEPGKSYKLDCNTCQCGPDGQAQCTLKGCATITSRSKRSPVPDDLPELAVGAPCEPGKSYKQDCNTCRCGPDGKAACTYKLCPPKRTRRSSQFPPVPADGTCEPGKTYQKDCNTCLCAPNGKLGACTVAACISKRSAEPEECKAEETKQEACNTCHCTNGLWSCTKKSCPSRKRRAVCNVGETKKLECNNCKCTQLGNGSADWACTKLACPPVNAGRTRRDVGVTSDLKNTPCAPDDSFQLDCNTCYCNSAKTGYLCTEYICSPDNSTETSSLSTDLVTSTTETATLNSAVTENVSFSSTAEVSLANLNLTVENTPNITSSITTDDQQQNLQASDTVG